MKKLLTILALTVPVALLAVFGAGATQQPTDTETVVSETMTGTPGWIYGGTIIFEAAPAAQPPQYQLVHWYAEKCPDEGESTIDCQQYCYNAFYDYVEDKESYGHTYIGWVGGQPSTDHSLACGSTLASDCIPCDKSKKKSYPTSYVDELPESDSKEAKSENTLASNPSTVGWLYEVTIVAQKGNSQMTWDPADFENCPQEGETTLDCQQRCYNQYYELLYAIENFWGWEVIETEVVSDHAIICD